MGKREDASSEELSLKEKYALMRKKKADQEKEKAKEKEKVENDKLVAAKKIYAASLQKEAQQQAQSGDKTESKLQKRPVALERKLTEMKERGITTPEPKRQRISEFQEPTPATEYIPNPNPGPTDTYHYQDKPPQNQGGFRERKPRKDEPTEMTEDGEYYPTTIFVGDLSPESKESDIEAVFVPFGAIDCIRMVPGKNFCFVKYVTRDSALQSIAAMNGYILNESRIRVFRAKVPSNKGRWGHAGGRDAHRNDFDNRMDQEERRDRPRQQNKPFNNQQQQQNQQQHQHPHQLPPHPHQQEATPNSDADPRRNNSNAARALRTYDDL